jgi:uncharacterized SAM-binding protein YcdF (DUF218 family)
MKKLIAYALLSWLVFVALPSVPKIRSILSAPLVVTNENAAGDACYVLSAGNALWERLAAASDLYHMKRVPKVIIMRNDEMGPYSFPAKVSWSQTQWAMDYLMWRGVPREKIEIVEKAKGLFGTHAEAKNIARSLKPDIKQLVLVTSAPHTRRSVLAFKRALPASITLITYAATSFETSAEYSDPIWLEYLKLLTYSAILWS